MLKINIKLKRDNFDLVINEKFDSGITGIFGASGSGKTSLMHSIAGLENPCRGTIVANGQVLYDSKTKVNIPVHRRNIGYVLQEGRLFPHMTVEQNLKYGLKKGGDKDLCFSEVVELLNIGHLLKSKPKNISGGERQRTAIGRALLSSPRLLLLDEPFSALDSNLRDQILPFLIKIHKLVRIPILIVSHDLSDLLKLTTRLFLMNRGECIGHGDYYDLLRRRDVSEALGVDSLLNAFTMKVSKSNGETGLTVFSHKNEGQKIKVLCEQSNGKYEKGDYVRIFIRPDDIALSSIPLEQVTIQNQVQGTITNVIERNHVRLCIVDIGFPLIVKITAQSAKRMKIEKGSNVWCLFKSVAIDVAG